MSAPEEEIVTCASCSSRFRRPASPASGDHITCPSCGKPLADPATDGGSPPADHLPGLRQKAVNLDLSGILVRESNPQAQPLRGPERNLPKLQNPKKLAKTSDEAFASDDEAPRERVMSSRDRQQMVGWDDHSDGDPVEPARATSPPSMRFFVGAGILIVSAVVLVILARPKGKSDNVGPDPAPADIGAPATTPEETVAEGPVDNLVSKLGSNRVYEIARHTVEQFLAAPDIATRLTYCRQRERVRPLMEDYYSRHAIGPIQHGEISEREILEDYLFLEVELDGADRHPAVLSRDGDSDRLVVDWESFVAYGEMDFDKFVAGRVSRPTLMRVLAEPDDYYNFGFTDDAYLCIRLMDQPTEEQVYGYAPVGSEVAQSLVAFFARSNALANHIVLRLRYPNPPASPNQVVIEEVVAQGWVIK